MELQELLTNLSSQFVALGQQVFPDMPENLIRLGGSVLLGILALLLLICGLILLRRPKPRNSSSTRTDIPRAIQKKGMVLDILNNTDEDKVAVRCVITGARTSKVKCEIVERLDVLKTKEGKDVTCVFAPLKTRQGKVNSFTARLLESDRSGRNADRIILSGPTAYALIPRRKHSRKRVADQQFIRVKLWVEDPFTSTRQFEDAAPHIGVNSFSTNGSDQNGNGVINISTGGIGLSIRDSVIPENCGPGATVTINLFMFNFREKTFKPYWYSGTVRTMEESRPGFTRIGIEFDGSAHLEQSTGELAWTRFDA